MSTSAITSMPSIPSVPLISARPSFSASTTGVRPASASACGGRAAAARAGRSTSPSPISASATVASGARSPEQPSDPYSGHDRGDAGAEHRGQRRRGLRPDTGAAPGQGGQPQQHQGADHLASRPVRRCRRRASGSARSAARPGGAAGSTWWPARRTRWRCRSAAPRRRRGARRSPATAAIAASASGAEVDGSAVPAHRDDLVEAPARRTPSRTGRRVRRRADRPAGAGASPMAAGLRSACVDCHRFIGCRPARRRERAAGDCVRYTGQMPSTVVPPDAEPRLPAAAAGPAPALRRGLAVLRLLGRGRPRSRRAPSPGNWACPGPPPTSC